MTSRHPVTFVCVDLGGVVVRIRRTLADTLHAVGVPSYVLEEIREEELVAFRECVAMHQRGEHAFDAWLDAAHAALGARIDRETILRAHDAILVGEYPGVAHALGALRACRTRMIAIGTRSLNCRVLRRSRIGTRRIFLVSRSQAARFTARLSAKQARSPLKFFSSMISKTTARQQEVAVGMPCASITNAIPRRKSSRRRARMAWRAELRLNRHRGLARWTPRLRP